MGLNHRNIWSRIVSGITIASFVFTSSAWGLPAIPQLGTDLSTLHSEIEIPEELASVEQAFLSRKTNRPLVIYIQNAHSSSEAQKQIKSLLSFLSKNLGVKLALVEGALNEIDPSLLRFFSDGEINRKVGEHLVNQGLLSGIQLFLMDAGEDFRAFGVEDANLYRENLTAFRQVMREESTIQKYVGHCNTVLTGLQQKLFDRELEEVVAKQRAYHDRRLGLLPYVTFLRSKARETLGIDLTSSAQQFDWPALVRLSLLEELEEVNHSMLEEEYARLDARLANSGLAENVRRQLRELKERSSQKSQNLIYTTEPRFLVEQMYLANTENGFSLEEYPHVTAWLSREILGSELDGAQLMGEIDRLGQLLLDQLADLPGEKSLLTLIEDFDLFRAALKLELAGEQFDNLVDRRDFIGFNRFTERLDELEELAGVPASARKKIEIPAGKIDALLESVGQFYILARLRDEAMAKNAERIIASEGAPISVMITGGFHTPGILSKLREHDYSYITLTPRLGGDIDLDRTQYISNLMNTHPNLFARAHLDAPVPTLKSREDAIKLLPGGAAEYAGLAGMLFTGILHAIEEERLPAAVFVDQFQPNRFLDVRVALEDRHAVFTGFGAVVEVPVFQGIIELKSASVERDTQTPPFTGVEDAEILERQEERLLDLLKKLALPKTFNLISETDQAKLGDLVGRAFQETGEAVRAQIVGEIGEVLSRLSLKQELGILPLRGLITVSSPSLLLNAIRDSGLAESLGAVADVEKPVSPESVPEIPTPQETSEIPATIPDVVSGFGATVLQSNIKEAAAAILEHFRIESGAVGPEKVAEVMANHPGVLSASGDRLEIIRLILNEIMVPVEESEVFIESAVVLDEFSRGEIMPVETPVEIPTQLIAQVISLFGIKNVPQIFPFSDGMEIVIEQPQLQTEIVAVRLNESSPLHEPHEFVSPVSIGKKVSGAPIVPANIAKGEKVAIGRRPTRTYLVEYDIDRGILIRDFNNDVASLANVQLTVKLDESKSFVTVVNEAPRQGIVTVAAPSAGFGAQAEQIAFKPVAQLATDLLDVHKQVLAEVLGQDVETLAVVERNDLEKRLRPGEGKVTPAARTEIIRLLEQLGIPAEEGEDIIPFIAEALAGAFQAERITPKTILPLALLLEEISNAFAVPVSRAFEFPDVVGQKGIIVVRDRETRQPIFAVELKTTGADAVKGLLEATILIPVEGRFEQIPELSVSFMPQERLVIETGGVDDIAFEDNSRIIRIRRLRHPLFGSLSGGTRQLAIRRAVDIDKIIISNLALETGPLSFETKVGLPEAPGKTATAGFGAEEKPEQPITWEPLAQTERDLLNEVRKFLAVLLFGDQEVPLEVLPDTLEVLSALRARESQIFPNNDVIDALEWAGVEVPSRDFLPQLAWALTEEFSNIIRRDTTFATRLLDETLNAFHVSLPRSFQLTDRVRGTVRVILQDRTFRQPILALDIDISKDEVQLLTAKGIEARLTTEGERLTLVPQQTLIVGRQAFEAFSKLPIAPEQLKIHRTTDRLIVTNLALENGIISVNAPQVEAAVPEVPPSPGSTEEVGFGLSSPPQSNLPEVVKPLVRPLPESTELPELGTPRGVTLADIPRIPRLFQPPDLSRFTPVQLREEVQQFVADAGFNPTSTTVDEYLDVERRVAEISHRLHRLHPAIQELYSRGSVGQIYGEEGVPVEVETSNEARPSLVSDLSPDIVEQLANSGGVTYIFDLREGPAPSREILAASLLALAENSFGDLKQAYIVITPPGGHLDFQKQLSDVARGFGIASNRFQVIPFADVSELKGHLAKLPARLARYPSERVRAQHVTTVLSDVLRDQLADYFPDGSVVIGYEPRLFERGDAQLHAAFIGKTAAIRSVVGQIGEALDRELPDLMQAFSNVPGRTGFFNYLPEVALKLQREFAALAKVLASV